MPAVFNALPGFEVPMGSVLPTVASLWEMGSAGAKSAPSEYRASQMTLVLHLGHDHTPDTARSLFEAVLRFSQRYPCRIVALCPRATEGGAEDRLEAKVFAECYIGKSRAEMNCCEAIIVGYPRSQRGFLENQVTTLIESDLPLYYWPSRIRSAPKILDYGFFLKHAARIVIDSAIENETVLNFGWPRRGSVRDLADSRLLHVRQSVGQFLSSFAPAELVDGLTRVEIASEPRLKAELGFLRSWVESRLEACARSADAAIGKDLIRTTEPRRDRESMGMAWTYRDDRFFHWTVDFESGRASIEAALGGVRTNRNSLVRLLSTGQALGEALFF